MLDDNQLPDGLAKDADAPKSKLTQKLNLYLFIANIAVAVCWVIAVIAMWKHLPQTIPMHWSRGVIDRYGDKNEFFTYLILLVFSLIDVLMYFVIKSKKDFGLAETCVTHGLNLIAQVALIIIITVAYSKYIS